MRSKKPILFVEDDHVDAMTVKRALDEINVTNQLDIVSDGEKALAYLKDPEKEMPCIILLDFDMPRMNGIEFLQIAKKDEDLKRIPTVVLTTSKEEQHKVESFNLGVAGYMVKSADYIQFVKMVKAIDYYWTISELPNNME